MHAAYVISSRPTDEPPANGPQFAPRLHGYSITCRLPGGVETTVTAIAPNSTMAIDYCHGAFACVMGVIVKTLLRCKAQKDA